MIEKFKIDCMKSIKLNGDSMSFAYETESEAPRLSVRIKRHIRDWKICIDIYVEAVRIIKNRELCDDLICFWDRIERELIEAESEHQLSIIESRRKWICEALGEVIS